MAGSSQCFSRRVDHVRKLWQIGMAVKLKKHMSSRGRVAAQSTLDSIRPWQTIREQLPSSLTLKHAPNRCARMLAHVYEDHERCLLDGRAARGCEADACRLHDAVVIHPINRVRETSALCSSGTLFTVWFTGPVPVPVRAGRCLVVKPFRKMQDHTVRVPSFFV